jgi:hypothetical protein
MPVRPEARSARAVDVVGVVVVAGTVTVTVVVTVVGAAPPPPPLTVPPVLGPELAVVAVPAPCAEPAPLPAVEPEPPWPPLEPNPPLLDPAVEELRLPAALDELALTSFGGWASV